MLRQKWMSLVLFFLAFCFLFSACDESTDEVVSAPPSIPELTLDPLSPPQTSEDLGPLPQQPTPTPPVLLFSPAPLPETMPESDTYRFTSDVRVGGETVESYRSPYDISFGLPDEYTELGVTTFRGSNFRDRASWSKADIQAEELTLSWTFNTSYIDKWTGVGWNGQPSLVCWDAETRQIMNLYPEKKAKDGLVECIYGTLDGKIYFLDAEDGTPTRDPIVLGEPIKGSITIDPRGYPLLYVGQGIAFGSRFGYYFYSLIDGKELFFINGRDTFALRGWGAFDSNPLIDAQNDLFIECGENGVVYTVKLNTQYDKANGTISIDPDVTRYRYKYNSNRQLGSEGSPTAFSHYLFFANNGGLVQCVDLHTLKPVWVRSCTDDTDASVVLSWEDDTQSLALYTSNEVDYQGAGGLSYVRKLDAQNGALLWEHSYTCQYSSTNGGSLATPTIGRFDLEGRVYFWIAKTTDPRGNGVLVCVDTKTGDILWEKFMPHYGWSSPVPVYTRDGKGYLVVCDSVGYMYLIEGTTGETLSRVTLSGNVEGSPAVYGNTIIVGTRAQKIHCVTLS